MPEETKQAIVWALQQKVVDPSGNEWPVTLETEQELVDFVRLYFNDNGISYSTFSYDDLLPFLN